MFLITLKMEQRERHSERERVRGVNGKIGGKKRWRKMEGDKAGLYRTKRERESNITQIIERDVEKWGEEWAIEIDKQSK